MYRSYLVLLCSLVLLLASVPSSLGSPVARPSLTKRSAAEVKQFFQGLLKGIRKRPLPDSVPLPPSAKVPKVVSAPKGVPAPASGLTRALTLRELLSKAQKEFDTAAAALSQEKAANKPKSVIASRENMVKLRFKRLQEVKAKHQAFQQSHTQRALLVDELQTWIQRIDRQIRLTAPRDFAKIRVLEGQRTAVLSRLSEQRAQLQVLEQSLL
jgi:hypothetical protein